MQSDTYKLRRGELEAYFGQTAAATWAKLTSDAPVSGIRATVRAGRDAMRSTLLGWLPQNLSGARILDAGCGAGQFSVEAARRGGDVVAIDLAEALVTLAQQRAAGEAMPGRIDFRVGDMFDSALGRFDFIVAMDSLIHYEMGDFAEILAGFAARTTDSVLFSFAPNTPALSVMHGVGRLFPRGDRAPAIVPHGEAALRKAIAGKAALKRWTPARTERISSGFYTSQAMELARK